MIKTKNSSTLDAFFWNQVKKDLPDDHWIWTGFHSDKGKPIFVLQGCHVHVRQLIATLIFPQRGSLAFWQPAKVTCDEKRCINPSHFRHDWSDF